LSNSARPTDLVTIDTTTGAVSDVGASVDQLDAIVFVVVPEPNESALFGAEVILLSLLRFRQRRYHRAS